MTTDVVVMNDDPANWPADVNKNATDYLTKTPPNIPCKGFPKNRKGLCFSGKNVQMERVLKDLGYSALIEFIAFYCKLFLKNTIIALSTSGFNDWSNVHTRLA